jgi:RNA polymerase sigma-70 factor (ECF subfamily)
MLELLYRSYRAVMLQRAMGVLGDHALAEDAVHEAFIRISRHIKRFESMKTEERRYLCLTIVKNAALNMLRDRGITNELTDTHPAAIGDIALGIDISDAIDALEEGHRQVVLLRLRYGFDTFETARLLGIKSGTVRSRLNRARKILKESLK